MDLFVQPSLATAEVLLGKCAKRVFAFGACIFNLIDEVPFDKLVKDTKRMATGLVNKKAASSIATAATLEKRQQDGGVGGSGQGSNPLKSFSPFDPLPLSRSHEFIEPFYRHWQGPVEEEDVLVIDDGGDDEEEGVFEMDDDDDEDDGAHDEGKNLMEDAIHDRTDDTPDSPVIVSEHERKDMDE
jgi:RNA polymerase I-specific transcription initiation factor RRN3